MLMIDPERAEDEDIIVLAQAAAGRISRIYLHWTAGHYGQAYDDYHLNIDRDGTVYKTCRSLEDAKAHTWRRNGDSIGIALECCCGASLIVPLGAEEKDLQGVLEGSRKRPLFSAEIDYGAEGPTVGQVESAARLIALLCAQLHLDILPGVVMTHAEAAIEDGYGPCSDDPEMRWDLWFLPDPSAKRQLLPGGDLLRGKALWYLQKGKEGGTDPKQLSRIRPVGTMTGNVL